MKECESVLPPGHCDDLTFSRDGRTFAFLWHEILTRFSLFVWDAALGRELLNLDLPSGYSASLALSPDGSRVAVATVAVLERHTWRASSVRVWETATGRELFSRHGLHTGSNFLPAWSPDGRYLAINPGSSLEGDFRIVLLDAQTGADKATLKVGARQGDGPGL